MDKRTVGREAEPGRAEVSRGRMREVEGSRTTVEGDFYRKWRPLGSCIVCKKEIRGGDGVKLLVPKEGPLFLRASARVVHECC